jgi:hypothetical protein
MARHEIDYTVQEEGRDKGKVFHIKEMDAYSAQKWAVKLGSALINAGFPITEDILRGGMAAAFTLGFNSIRNLKPDDMMSVLDDLMTCVTIIRDVRNPQVTFKIGPDDIEEVSTRFLLAWEVFKLQTNFSTAAAKSTSIPDSKSAA